MLKTKFIFLGLSKYREFLELQEKLTEKKLYKGDKNSYIIITEHYPIYTLGKRINREDLPRKNLAPVLKLDRGGGITFHGFGQIVVYPIIDLKEYKLSLKEYIWTLEDIMIKTLGIFRIEAYRRNGLIGVFTDRGKIGFIGVKVSKFITNFGFSINYDVDKKFFENINPCGLGDKKIANVRDFIDISKERFINSLYTELKNYF
ncbi:MAG: lipoyl(octanoyl) transferase [Persephonella sp.]|nr:MAG: lipoyl(octanoyl) transferase [Persephonella sp.]